MLRKFWEEFLRVENRSFDTKYAGTICFGVDAHAAETAIEKIVSGEMRAAIYPANGYRRAMSGESKPGDLNIVVDWNGTPRAIIETTSVRRMAIRELTDDICRLEAAQNNLEAWREQQLPLIKIELDELGESFDENTLLTVEGFRTVYPHVEGE